MLELYVHTLKISNINFEITYFNFRTSKGTYSLEFTKKLHQNLHSKPKKSMENMPVVNVIKNLVPIHCQKFMKIFTPILKLSNVTNAKNISK